MFTDDELSTILEALVVNERFNVPAARREVMEYELPTALKRQLLDAIDARPPTKKEIADAKRQRFNERHPGYQTEYKRQWRASGREKRDYGEEVGHVTKFKFHTAQELFDWWMTH